MIRGLRSSAKDVVPHALPARWRLPLELRAQSNFAIVESDHLETGVDEDRYEVVVPVDQLTTETHDQKQWNAAAAYLVLDRDAVHFYRCHRARVPGSIPLTAKR